jgi:hypothetical protein
MSGNNDEDYDRVRVCRAEKAGVWGEGSTFKTEGAAYLIGRTCAPLGPDSHNKAADGEIDQEKKSVSAIKKRRARRGSGQTRAPWDLLHMKRSDEASPKAAEAVFTPRPPLRPASSSLEMRARMWRPPQDKQGRAGGVGL